MFDYPRNGGTMQLRVELQDISPPIWRQLVVPADLPLDVLHHILQISFGWEDAHLYAFRVGKIEFGPPGMGDGPLVVDDEGTPIGAIARKGTKVKYHYDFGDDWEHVITVEKVIQPTGAPMVIECLDGARACPPEDCGGALGYEHLLSILANPKDEDYKERKEWVGEDFDPEKFDAAPVNEQLSGIISELSEPEEE